MNNVTDNRNDLFLPINERKITQHNHKIIELKEKGKLIVPKSFVDKVRYLHKEVGPIEWSGRLVWRIIKGNIEDTANLVAEAVDIIPMDIGNATYTEFETGDEAIKYFQKYPKLLRKVKMGIIHTHHTMRAFFSGTDTGALEDCATTDSLLLSLIVNFKEEPVAKIAYMVPETTVEKVKYTPSNMIKNLSSFFLKDKEVEVTKDVLVTVNLDIEWKGENKIKDEYFLETLAELKKAKTASAVKIYKPSSQNGSHLKNTINKNQGSKIGKQAQIGFHQKTVQKNDFSLGNKGEEKEKDKKGLEILDSKGVPIKSKAHNNRFADEEEVAMKLFIYMCSFNEEELDPESNLTNLLAEDIEVFIMSCIKEAEDNYTGGEVQFDMKDAQRIAEHSLDFLQTYYELAFHTLDIEYQDKTLQSAIYKSCAKSLKDAPISSFLADGIADVLIDASESILIETNKTSSKVEEESIEEALHREWGEEFETRHFID